MIPILYVGTKRVFLYRCCPFEKNNERVHAVARRVEWILI